MKPVSGEWNLVSLANARYFYPTQLASLISSRFTFLASCGAVLSNHAKQLIHRLSTALGILAAVGSHSFDLRSFAAPSLLLAILALMMPCVALIEIVRGRLVVFGTRYRFAGILIDIALRPSLSKLGPEFKGFRFEAGSGRLNRLCLLVRHHLRLATTQLLVV